MEFLYSDEVIQPDGAAAHCHCWIEAVLHRKDRAHPTRVREYLDECYRPPFSGRNGYVKQGPWQSHPKRMLRHKAEIQCFRIGFGFVGIFDEDEAKRIIEGEVQEVPATTGQTFEQKVEQLENRIPRTLSEEERADLHEMVMDLVERAAAQDTWSASRNLIVDRCDSESAAYALKMFDVQKNNIVNANAVIEEDPPKATSKETPQMALATTEGFF